MNNYTLLSEEEIRDIGANGGAGRDFRCRTLRNHDFSGLDFSGAIFCDARLENCTFRDCNFTAAELGYAQVYSCKFDRSTLVNAQLARASIRHSSFDGADCTDASFSGATLSWSSFYKTVLDNVNMYEATGNGTRIWSLRMSYYDVVIYDDRMQIGCQNHTVEEWLSFSDEELSRIARRPVENTAELRPVLTRLYDFYKLTATGVR